MLNSALTGIKYKKKCKYNNNKSQRIFNITLKATQSPKALFFAESGASDALQKIVRNKNFTATSSYEVEFAPSGCTNLSGCAIISVEATNYGRSITSTGKFKSSVRTIHVEVNMDDQDFGEIESESWQEVIN